ncbi:MAG: mandelate racemase/muconate lactonizing enzyme family protein [Alphaproteobacteria bacterium]|nr:mandelate racemase/muconate lactonizing enzyme family protein [Alphaproteobacteria bacterium]
MRITSIETFAVKFAEGDFFGGKGADAPTTAAPYLVQPGWRGIYSPRIESMILRVATDAGIVGYGEGQSPVAPEVTATIVRRILAPVLVGRDPRAPRALRREMYDLMNLRGHTGGFMLDAITAVDTALWDIAGKAASLPIHRMLGGSCRSDVPVYVSGIRGEGVSEKLATMRHFIERGFHQFKLFGGFGVREDAELVEALIAGTGGTARVAIDALWKYDINAAHRLGRLLDKAGAVWFEAPVEPEDVRGNAELARALDVPIANGEALRSRLEFLPWLEARAIDLAQPDIGRCGISEGMAIIDLAEAFHIPVALHMGMASPVMIAATLQVAASAPQVDLVEYQPVVLGVANRLLKAPITCNNGLMAVPEGPGLGIEIDGVTLQRFAADQGTYSA